MASGDHWWGYVSRINAHVDLDVWQLAICLAEDCSRLTSTFPHDERFGLTSQVRRSAVSIPAIIAAGHGRDQTGSFVLFLRIAMGSTRALDTHLILCERFGIANSEIVEPIRDRSTRVSRMLRALIRSLEARGERA